MSEFFERALVCDPSNVEALAAVGFTDAYRAVALHAPDRGTPLATAEATLTKALSFAPEHPPDDR